MGFILERVFERCVRKSGDKWSGGSTNVGEGEESNKNAKQEGGICGPREENDTAHFLKWIRARREVLW